MRCLNKRFARCKRVWTLSTLIGKESDDNVKDVKKRHETFANVVRAPLGSYPNLHFPTNFHQNRTKIAKVCYRGGFRGGW